LNEEMVIAFQVETEDALMGPDSATAMVAGFFKLKVAIEWEC